MANDSKSRLTAKISITRAAGMAVWALGLINGLPPAAALEKEAAQKPVNECPEQCGAVLKLCMEVYRQRHGCLALTDACFQACKAGTPVLDLDGEVLPQWHPKENDERMIIRW